MVFSREEEGWVKPIVKMVRRTNTPTDIAFDYLCVEWSFAWRLLLLGKLLKYFNIDHKGAWRQLQRFRARNKINTKSSQFLRGWKIDKRSDSYSAYSTGKIIKLRGAVSSDNYDASFLTLLRALRVNLEIMKLGVKWRLFIHAFRLRLMINYLPCQAKKVTKFIFKVCLTESRNGSITTEDLKTTRREASKFIAFRAKNLLLSYRSKSALYWYLLTKCRCPKGQQR